MYLKPLHCLNACILVMEPDPAIQARLCRLLAEEGFRIVGSCDNSLQDATAEPAIDLVIAGLEPGHDHRSVMAALPRVGRAVPVVALIDHRTWVGFDFFDAADALGAAAVLQRPFPKTALLRLIAMVLSPPRGELGEFEGGALDGGKLIEQSFPSGPATRF